MGSQFSLSLELTRLVPFGSLVNAAGHGLVRLLRDIQTSGSDFVTEHDLAEAFGRNRVEPLFASTFRTAVKQSLIHEISGIAELVLEGGAGPTVRRSFNEPAYFAMVVQLSLLTFTHELTSLTKALIRSFERRAQGATEYIAPPRYDALIGTLRAIREQTCGFMWELIFSAVEKKLYPSLVWTDGSLYTIRTIPQVILQALLDSFTAIQHLPEHTHLRIASRLGIPTIIVWAHQVLGLSVKVEVNFQSHTFGEGPPSIYIDGDTRGSPQVTLLNETDDPFFQLGWETGDTRLEPVSRHPIKDYGTRTLRLRDDDIHRERAMVYAIVTSCIMVAREHNQSRESKIQEPSRLSCFPSAQRVLSVSKMLFAANKDVVDAIELSSELPCAARTAHLDSSPDVPPHFGGGRDLLYLTHVTLVLSMAEGFDEELALHIDALDEVAYMPFQVPDARRAFVSLALLLQRYVRYAEESNVVRMSVVSAWGWSLCLSSVACQDPSDVKAEVTFIRGVPARGGERKRYIVDGSWPLDRDIRAFKSLERSNFLLVSRPGDDCTLGSWTYSKKTRYYIGTTAEVFEVVKILSCDSLIPSNRQLKGETVSFGFRSMQELAWDVVHIPACNHRATLGQSATIPEGIWTFHGFQPPSSQRFPDKGIFAGLVAGDSSARWILVAVMKYAWEAQPSPLQKICVRGRECCFECSLHFAKSYGPGFRICLVL
ncbi:MAG: hypothetical protein Q9201_004285 [Fulgogasparrea decipioides]